MCVYGLSSIDTGQRDSDSTDHVSVNIRNQELVESDTQAAPRGIVGLSRLDLRGRRR